MLKSFLGKLLLRIRKRSAEWRALAFLTSVMIVFATTYALVLPAITLSTDSAEEMAGVYLEEEAMAEEDYESYDDGAYYEEEILPEEEPADETPDEEMIATDDTDEGTPDPDETGEEAEYIEPATTDEITSEGTSVSAASAISESSAENVSVTEEFLAPEELIEDGRYIIVRYGDDGNAYAMNQDGIAVPVVYDPESNIAYCEDENQNIVWIKEGHVLRSEKNTYIKLDDTTEDVPAVSDEEASLSAEKPDEGQYAGALYRTVVTDGVPMYYALVLSPDGTFFTTTIIDTKPVKRTILAKEAEVNGTESAAESVLATYEAGSVTVPVDGADYTIAVSWEADACIPGDAEFKAVSLDQEKAFEEYAEKAVEMAEAEQPESSQEKSSAAIGMFDLTIYDAAGQVVQPAVPISVSVDFGEALASETEVCAVHFPGTGVPEVTEDDGIEYDEGVAGTDTLGAAVIDAVNEDGAVSFDAESFSVYVIVGTKIEKNVLASDGHNYRITAAYGPETGIPMDADLVVEEIADTSSVYDGYVSKAENALEMEEKSAEAIRLFDISIVDKDGNKVQPAAGSTVDIRMELADVTDEDINVVHFTDESDSGSVMDTETDSQTVSFETDGFSVFAVVYTVDFEYSVNGKVYQFSLPGGGFVSFSELVEALGIFDDEANNAVSEAEELSDANTGTDANTDTNANESLMPDDVEVSEAAREFVADVASVEFSSPELVDVSKVEGDTTVGQLKESHGLKTEYSAELTEEQIAAINAQTVEAGDWALISMQPFESEETLTVTMKDGEVFTVKVTDAQIKKDFLSASGNLYTVTVTYGDEAGIPDGSILEVTEFEKTSTEYQQAYEAVTQSDSMQEMTGSGSLNEEKVEMETYDPGDGDGDDADNQNTVIIDTLTQSPVEMDVLDISIYDENHQPVEPKATVNVSLVRKVLPDDSPESILESTLTVNHLNDHKGDLNVETVAESAGEEGDSVEVGEESIQVEFLTESFSTYTVSWGGGLSGTGISAISPGQYIIYARDAANGNYYALLPQRNSNGTLNTVQLTNTNGVLSYSGDMSNLYWTYSNYGNSYRFSFRSANTTYYLAAGGFGYQVNTSTNGTSAYGNANTTLFGQYNDHLHAARDTFLRCYNGVFQFIHDVSSGWEGRSQVFFANSADTKTVTVHYGYMEGNSFKEFDELPEGAQESYGAPSMVGDQLNVRYDIEGKDYVTTRMNDPVNGTQISPLLQTEADSAAYWRYRVQSTTTVNGGIDEWQRFGNNDNDIYVIYRDTPTELSYDTGNIDPGDLEAPAATKDFESNHDGTYDLILGVTGKSNQAQQKTHANIVIVLDTSSSMDYTYSENPRTELGYSRLSAAKSAICDLADQLFGMNSEEDPAAIELAFVNFSHRVRNELTMQNIYSGTDASTFKNMINATNGNGGTNYDTAIEAANSILWNDADPTYVVFVTDGDTVSRGYLKYSEDGDGSDHASDWDGGTYYNHDTDNYGDTYLARARDAAKIQTDKVLNSGKKFYSIGVFGNVAYLDEMGGTYLGQANDRESIQNAFSKIISEIQLDLGYKDVVVNDGLTALTSTTLEHGSAGNFVYYRSGGTKEDGTEKYSSTANDGRGENWNIEEGSDKEAFFLEIKDADTFYKNGSEWTDISAEQKAAYIEKYGVGSRTVIWDLGEDILEDGVTYKVAFTIWPSQEAYDLVADLNNGTVIFEDLDDSVKSQIVETGGVYYVKTNTAATVDYTSVRVENGTVTETKTGSSTIKDPEGKMNLDTNIMSVRKEFAHLINESDPYEEIVFYLLVDGQYYNIDGTLSDTLDESKVYAINLPKDGEWEDTIYIAPGLMRGGEILETGHNYSLVEKIVSGNPYEYEFAPQTVRPMVITAVPTFLVKKDAFNTNTEDKQEYTFNDSASSYVVVSGKSDAEGTYYAASENNGSLTGVNHKTSELDITKIINDPQNLLTDAQEAAETFTYRVTLQIPDGCDPSGIVGYEYVPRTQSNAYTLYGYQTGQSAFAEDIARFSGRTYRAWNTLVYDALIEYDRVTENGNTFIRVRRDADGNIIWKIPASGGYHTVTYDMTLKQDEVIRFTNLPTGTKYSIQEIYANKYPADNAGGKTDGRTPVEDESNLSAEGYEVEKVQHTGGALSADNTVVEGAIEAADTRYYNQFTNKKVKRSALN